MYPNDPASVALDETHLPRRPRLQILRLICVSLAAVVSVLVLGLAAGNLVAPGANTYTLVSAEAWAFAGPHFVVASAVAVVISILALVGWRSRGAQVVALLAVGSLTASIAITSSLVGAAVVNGGSASLVTALNLASTDAEPTSIQTYAVADGENLQALVYEPTSGAKGSPVMMYIHGGGWVLGSAQDSAPTARWWAEQGWYVVSVDYRLATASRPTWDLAPADVGCALAWTAQKAASAGANSDKLVVAGDSAGGNLSLLLGWSSAAGVATSTCPDRGEPPIPDAIVVGYPVANPIDAYENGYTWFGQAPQAFTRDFLGGTPAANPDRLAAVSPATYLSGEVPATLIVQPERDDFIPASGNYEVAEDAVAAGADVSVVRVPFAHHGFDFIPSALGGQVKLTIAANWLADRGLAPLR